MFLNLRRYSARAERCAPARAIALLSSALYVLCGLLTGARVAAAEGWQVVEAFPHLEFEQPVDLRSAPGFPGKLFVVEKAGRIRWFVNSPASDQSVLLLDISDRVNSKGMEEGLLGLVFHPKFADNGIFFVYYTASGARVKHVSRFHAGKSLRVDPDSEEVLLTIPQPFENHNGGSMMFGPDGYLYIGVGDGGGSGDPDRHGQSLSTLLGKLLRIDVDRRSAGEHYGIPADNPFVDWKNARPEIFAFGLRNPWRFSFDSSTGALWLGDVGQNRFEEVDIVKKGGNYGWNVYEGKHCFSPEKRCEQPGIEMPVYEYGRDEGICVTGGFVYRGTKFPELTGLYIYGDYGSGRIWALSGEAGKEVRNDLLVKSSLNPSTFGVDAKQELYIVSLSGRIYQLSH